MTLTEILQDIHAVDKALASFEQRYGLLSDTFFVWYQAGHEPEEQEWVLDFAEWSGLYKSRRRLLALYQQKLDNLRVEGLDLNQVMRQTQRAVAA